MNAAEALANMEKYDDAIKTLEAIDSPNSDVKVLLADYTQKYESQVIAQADLLVGAGDYDSAIDLIADALTDIPDSAVLLEKKKNTESEKPKLFMEVAAPYDYDGNYRAYTNGEIFSMGGERYTNGFILGSDSAEVFSNLAKQYNTIEFVLGRVDGSDIQDNTLYVFLDGFLYAEYLIKGDSLPTHSIIPVGNVGQVRFELAGGWAAGRIGLGNMIIR
jgi:tetratricopeptide (TPR) repeat protein